jgi:ATP-dependent Lhr-like helicase
MEPATSVEYTDFLIRWQHLHPDRQLSELDGLRQVIGQIQGQENYQAVFERDVFPSRVRDYDPSMLDRLCYGGEVLWRRFDYRTLKRGQIGFQFRKDRDWILVDPSEVEMKLNKWDDDIPEPCDIVRKFLAENGACFFDDIVKGTKQDWRLVLRAIWHLVWTGEATNDSFESIRHADFNSGLSGCYDLGTKPRRKGVTIDFIVRHMLENRKLDPTLGRWVPTERLVPSVSQAFETDEKMLEWANLLLRRYGIVCRDMLKREVIAPKWRDLRRALVRFELLGKVRRGFFVEDLSGEQYAYQEAVDLLREAKLRHQNANDDETGERAQLSYSAASEPMILLNVCDPANLFGYVFPTTNEVGDEIRYMRTPHKYLVVQAGQPILLYEKYGSIKLLVDLSRKRAEKAIRTVLRIIDEPAKVSSYDEVRIRDWNGHPIDVSPARHLLAKVGFLDGGRGDLVYDGTGRPDHGRIAISEEQMPEVFEHFGKERAPVKYDAEWIVSRSPQVIRAKVRELIELLERILPEEFEPVYYPRHFSVHYRGVRCIHPHVQQKRIRLYMTQEGWWTGRSILIDRDTDLNAPAFVSDLLGRFERGRQLIDSKLDSGRR